MHWGAPTAHLALVSARVVVIRHPIIQIDLQLFNGLVNLAPECYLVELLQDSLVEAFADAVGLWMVDFGSGMLNVVQRQVELVIVVLRFAAIFGTTVGQDADDSHALHGKERQHPIIEQISRCDRRFGGIQLSSGPLGIGIDEGLLINPAHALDSADIKGILTA